MPGRLLDWLGQGDAADRPAAADVNGTGPGQLGIPLTSAVFYFANDTKVLSIYDEVLVSWFEVDAVALSTLSFETLPDVDWSTPPTDGQVFAWDLAAGKLEPISLQYQTLLEITDDLDAAFADGAGINVSYAAGVFTFTSTITQYTDELAQDALAGAFAAGTHSGITITYNDVANSFDFTVSGATYTDEMAQDAVGGILLDSSTINFVYDDGAGTITADLIDDSVGAEKLETKPYHVISFLNDITASAVININSTTYVIVLPFQFWVDFPTFPATHFRVVGRGASNAAGATIDMQVARAGTPTVGIHTGGNDVTGIPNANTDFDSGWRSIDVAIGTMDNLVLAIKGSTATVDFSAVKPVQIMFKVDP